MRHSYCLIILLFIVFSVSCDFFLYNVCFFPDNSTYIPEDKFPEYVELVKIKTTDNVIINGLYFSENRNKRKMVLISFHGNAENIYVQFDHGVKLFRMGVDVLLVSYRGYAKSRGSPSEKGIYTDGRSALDYAINVLGYNINNIIICGRSIGTTVAVEISQKRDIAGLILLSPLSSGQDFVKSMGMSSMKFLVGSSFDSISKINNIRCPLLVIHGDSDEVISYSLGYKLFDEYNGKKEFIYIKNGGHNNLAIIDPDLYWSTIEKFIIDKLKEVSV